jgi:hypothetical protein
MAIVAVATWSLFTFVTPKSGGASPVPLEKCSDLIVGAGSPAAAAGSAWMEVLLVNNGTRCEITGYPRMQFFDAKGNLIDRINLHSGAGEYSTPTPKRVILGHWSVASFGVTWNDNPVGSQHCPTTAWATISLPGEAQTSVGANVAPCGGGVVVTPIELGAVPAK